MGTRRALIAYILGLTTMTLLLATGLFVASREHTINAAQQDLLATDRIIAAHVEHEFATMLSVLGAAADSVGERLLAGALPPHEAHERLAAMKAGLPFVDGMIIADAKGAVRAGSDPNRTRGFDVSDRAHFERLRGGDVLVDVSEPLRTRSSAQMSFIVARRIESDGAFAGIAAAAVLPERIGGFFGQIRTDPDIKLSVVRLDGTMLFRVPDGHVGTKVVPHWRREGKGSGATRFTSVIDGVERIAAYHVLTNMPVVVVVSRDLDEVLAPWRRRATLVSAGAALMLGIVVPLGVFARHQLRRRRAAVLALRGSERRLRAILEASPFPILVSAMEEGAVQIRNGRATDLFGPAGCAVGLLESALFADNDQRRALRDQLRRTGAVQDAETRLIDRHGRAFWALVSAAVVTDPDGDLVIAAVNDISARKRSEEEANTARASAEASLHELRRAQKHLVETEKLASLGALVAGIAHEVNTPIGIAVTTGTYITDSLNRFIDRVAAGSVRRADFDDFVQMQREATELLVTNVRRAADLIQSFKRMSTDQASDAWRRFTLRQAIDDTVLSLTPSWKRTGHSIEVDCDPAIEIDGYPGVLSQVLTNLIVNADVHAWEPGGHGRIHIAARLVDPDTVEIRHRDDGRGIPTEHLDRIFDPFFTTRRGAGSTGLGLNIVHTLMTGPMRGNVHVHSAPGAGTEFVLRFPRALPPDVACAPAPAAAPPVS